MKAHARPNALANTSRQKSQQQNHIDGRLAVRHVLLHWHYCGQKDVFSVSDEW